MVITPPMLSTFLAVVNYANELSLRSLLYFMLSHFLVISLSKVKEYTLLYL